MDNNLYEIVIWTSIDTIRHLILSSLSWGRSQLRNVIPFKAVTWTFFYRAVCVLLAQDTFEIFLHLLSVEIIWNFFDHLHLWFEGGKKKIPKHVGIICRASCSGDHSNMVGWCMSWCDKSFLRTRFHLSFDIGSHFWCKFNEKKHVEIKA